MKKFFVILVVLAVIAGGLFAEGNKEAQKSTKSEVVTMQVGFENAMFEPVSKAIVKWQELVEEEGDGSLNLELFPDSQLGSKNELIDSMLLGEPVITIADASFLAEYGAPDLGIQVGPFFFTSWDQCWKLIDSDWYKEQCQKLADKGIKVLSSNWIYGDRHILTTKKVETVDDLAGLKIRVPNNKVQVEGINVLGASATGMSLGDVYQALQAGTIDGAENPLSTLYGRKLHEVAKYLILDAHVKMNTVWLCSNDFFESLTPAQQELLVNTANEAGLYNNELKQSDEAEYLQKMINEGCVVVNPSAEVIQGFVEKSKAFYADETKFGWTKGLYNKVQAIINN